MAEELAKLAQNPVGNLVNVPFQNNANLNYGPEKETQNILNIQPVIPVSISSDWNVITRTILPVIHMPRLGPNVGSQDGIGDTVSTAFCRLPIRDSGFGARGRCSSCRPTTIASSATTVGVRDCRSRAAP